MNDDGISRLLCWIGVSGLAAIMLYIAIRGLIKFMGA
jgi:hypothetical protein